MTTEIRLSKRDEAIFEKMKAHQKEVGLTDDEMAWVRRWARLSSSLGILTDFVIKLAAAVAAITALMTWWPRK